MKETSVYCMYVPLHHSSFNRFAFFVFFFCSEGLKKYRKGLVYTRITWVLKTQLWHLPTCPKVGIYSVFVRIFFYKRNEIFSERVVDKRFKGGLILYDMEECYSKRLYNFYMVIK